jgi:hypothetical protein
MGNKEIATTILEDLQATFVEHTLQGYGHGEEMFYLPILDKYYDQIERSYGDYNTILNNQIHITEGLYYILMVVNKYLHYGYYRECNDSCEKVLYSLENFLAEPNYEVYFQILFSRYVSLFYLDREKAKQVAQELMLQIESNDLIRHEYNKNKTFYDAQFSFVLK